MARRWASFVGPLRAESWRADDSPGPYGPGALRAQSEKTSLRLRRHSAFLPQGCSHVLVLGHTGEMSEHNGEAFPSGQPNARNSAAMTVMVCRRPVFQTASVLISRLALCQVPGSTQASRR